MLSALSRSQFRLGAVCFCRYQSLRHPYSSLNAVDTGERIGMDFFGQKVEKEYGVPFYQIHVWVLSPFDCAWKRSCGSCSVPTSTNYYTS